MGIAKFFNKLGSGATKFFSKVAQDAPKVLGKISGGLGSVGRIASSIASNPIVTALLGPEANVLAGGVSALANGGSGLTNIKNYSGDANQVSQNILERAQKLKDTAQNHPAFV